MGRRFSIAVVLLCAPVLLTCGKPLPKKSPSLASRVELATGNVTIKPAGGAWSQAIAGLVLRHGTEVKVGPGDRALIRLDDGSGIFLRHGSHIKLQAGGLSLVTGEAWIDAPPRDKKPSRYTAGEVTVSASNAGLDLKRSSKEVEVYVARGLAVVSSPGGRSEVQAGERARVAAGKGAPAISAVAFWEDWTGGMPDRRLTPGMGAAGNGRIYAIDRARPGTPPRDLEIRAQYVSVLIRDGVARTTVDQRFFNPSSAPVEGYYWFTIPEGAAVDRFALQVGNRLVDGEVVERKQARAGYEAAVRQRAFDPALLEWIDGRTFRARIFPIPAAGERRVVLSYLQLLPGVDNRTHYVYPMGGAGTRIQEFALEVDLGKAGESTHLATSADARIEKGGRRVTVRRSGYKPQGDFLLEMTAKKSAPLRAVRVKSSRNEADYVMLRYSPDIKWEQMKKVPGHVVVVVDTSAGGDSAGRQLRTDVAEAILRALSTSDRFALVAVDLKPRVLFPSSGLAPADEANIGKALEQLSGVRSGGATDLGAMFDVALKRLHGSAQPAVVYIGDGQATVGEVEGDALAGRVTRSFAGSRARLFSLAVGSGARHGLLARLARIGGGRTFRVDGFEHAVQEALRFVGHLKTPTITDLSLDLGAGMDQLFSSATGKVSRGQEVTIVARTHHPLPEVVRITGKLAGKDFSRQHALKVVTSQKHGYVPRLWARQYLTHLMGIDREKNRGTIIRLGLDYALMTPFTSFLVLDSEAAYQRMGIQRKQRDPLWGHVPQAALRVLPAANLGLGLFGCNSSAPTADEESPSWLKKKADDPAPSTPPALSTGSAGPAEQRPARQGALATVFGSRAKRARPPSTTRGSGAESEGSGHASPPRKLAPPADEAKSEDADRISINGKAGVGRKLSEKKKRLQDGRSSTADRLLPLLRTCSDAARRSLSHRRAIWQRRLDSRRAAAAGSVAAVVRWMGIYRQAAARCELPHWRDRKELLDLVQRRVRSPGQVRMLLSRMPAGRTRSFLRRRLLRRAVTPGMASALTDTVDWAVVDAALSKQQDSAARIKQLQKICKANPTSTGCTLRLVMALLDAERGAEALAMALAARGDGLATPLLMQHIGDMLAAAGRTDEAKRAYSEIVEFSPDDPAARLMLGDIYLRHRWYGEAYRQYRTIPRRQRARPATLLRLAAAAAGTGRVDKALRIERRVLSGEGEPGPADPRRWARLWSAARMARLMLGPKAKKSEGMRQSMDRGLRRLQVLSSPGVLLLLTWEDMQARLTLTAGARGTALDAGTAGLYAVTLGSAASSGLTVKRASGTSRAVKYQVAVIRWDGKKIRVSNLQGELAGKTASMKVVMR